MTAKPTSASAVPSGQPERNGGRRYVHAAGVLYSPYVVIGDALRPRPQW
jgi:hypothetical protein